MALFTFWVGFEVDESIPQDHMVEKWPTGMKGWTSGYGDGFSTKCARVDADSPAQAESIVRSCYGPSADKIRMRWEPEEHEHGWRPTGGRFPE